MSEIEPKAESSQNQATAAPSSSYSREPFLIVHHEDQRSKDVYGSVGDAVVMQGQLLRPDRPSRTAVVAMHPIGSPGYLPMFSGLARGGFHVVACANRYSNGDSALQMENVLIDLGACVRETRERFGYEKVVLAGWSGGGSLMAGYQAEAEHPLITQTAAGEPTPLSAAALAAADGLLLLAAHRSRHHLVTEFMDASILDENNADKRETDLDLYAPENPAQPPYTPAFLDRYRSAQQDRNRRITAYAKEHLEDLRKQGRSDEDHCFVVHGTMADPRWLDPTIESNDRRPGWSYMGDPRIVNDSPAGLARFTTSRSWLSQWSLDDAQVDAIDAGPRISVPALVMANSRDDACPTSHTQGIYDALNHTDKEYVVIPDADHYFTGTEQKSHLHRAVDHIGRWMEEHGFSD